MSLDSDLAIYRWLVGAEGSEWLTRAAALEGSLTTRVARLRRDLTAERVRLVLEQVELRRRAREKFVQAQRMFFTRVALEQATDEWVARHKAARFPPGQETLDLCCGVGGDLLGLAARGPSRGVERDPITACLAEANCQALGFPHTPVATADASHSQPQDVAAWHIDPDRRASGQRSTHVELHEPAPEVIDRLLAANDSAAIKLAPAAALPAAWAEQAELEWISRQGECRQLVVWRGKLAGRTGARVATILSGAEGVRTLKGVPGTVPSSPHIGRYVFEPDAAVLASRLTSVLAEAHGIGAVSPGVAYLTGDKPIGDPALAAFEVQEVLPLDRKRLKALLRERGIGRLEVKKRVVDCDPEQLRHELHVEGEAAATLLVAPVGGRVVAILASRVDSV